MLNKSSILKKQRILIINSNFYSKKKEISKTETENVEKKRTHNYIGIV